jgi:hypothetical protein
MTGKEAGRPTPDPEKHRNHDLQAFKDSEFCPWCRKPRVQRTNLSEFEEDE